MTNYQSTFSGTYLRVVAGLTFATEIFNPVKIESHGK